VYPDIYNVYNAIDGLRPEDIRVIILGQDPYHEPNQAHGLSFSVPNGVPLPKSLKNIYKEMSSDLGVRPPTSGNLSAWKKQGVLLLNTVLTVRKGKANTHRNYGWEVVTAAIIDAVLDASQNKVVILWGAQANESFRPLYAEHKRTGTVKNIKVIVSPHPSPLSAYRGFFGSKPFSKTNEYFQKLNEPPIIWA
jgi:uracil-DNA glycosylase